jgi:uncharacterized protein
LDATGVHPESYEATNALLIKLGMTLEDVKQIQTKASLKNTLKEEPKKESSTKQNKKASGLVVKAQDTALAKALAAAMSGTSAPLQEETRNEYEGSNSNKDKQVYNNSLLSKKAGDKVKLSKELGIGEITLTDIIKELEKPGRDPRDEMPKPILRTDVLEMSDLKEGMILKGTVRNVIDFGAFVDIGVHQDGLVHISQLSNKRFVKHPLDVVSVGDIVEVKVLSVEASKNRIGLTMII